MKSFSWVAKPLRQPPNWAASTRRFEQRGYTLKGLKLLIVERSLAEKHYEDLSHKPFFGALVDYICR